MTEKRESASRSYFAALMRKTGTFVDGAPV